MTRFCCYNKLTDHLFHFPTNAAVTCRLTLPPMEGTTFEPVYRNVFSPGETVRVNCGPKYWISDHQSTSAVTTCQEDGEWSLRPICQGTKLHEL